MYCVKCGTQNDDDSKFCIKCGTDIQEHVEPVNNDIDVPVISKKIGLKIGLKNKKTLRTIAIIIWVIIILLAIVIILPKFNSQNNDGSDDIDGYIEEPTFADDMITSGTVQISISSDPSDANIYIDSAFKGTTPVNISLPEGNYRLKMNLTGYKSIATDFNITSDMERQEISIIFEPIDVP